MIPGLVRSKDQRALLREMLNFTGKLPGLLHLPLKETMYDLTTLPEQTLSDPHSEAIVRNLADFAVLINRQTSLGFCLQRSLTRYYFLRREGLPVVVHFGARHADKDRPLLLAGHAWLALEGDPYYEEGEHWRGYVVMLSFPEDA